MNPGDKAAIKELMEAHFSSIWAYVFLRTRNNHIADDLTQDVFVRAYTHWAEFRRDASPKTWLFTIARNLCRDHVRSAFVRRERSTDRQYMDDHVGHQASAEEQAVRQILADELWNHLLVLPLRQREVILLHLREDLTFHQIAGITHTKEVTVRARYRRGVERLRRILNGGDTDVL